MVHKLDGSTSSTTSGLTQKGRIWWLNWKPNQNSTSSICLQGSLRISEKNLG